MVRISDIIRDEDLFKTTAVKSNRIAISEILAADDIIGNQISPGLRAPTTQEEQDAKSMLNGLYTALAKAHTLVREGKRFAVEPFGILAEKFINTLDRYDNIYMLAEYGDYDGTDYIRNSLWTALISAKIGRRLGLERKELGELILCCFFHDIGTGHLNNGVLAKPGELTGAEREEIQKHPVFGREILLSLGESHRYISDAAFQEHERMDGSGYPTGLGGEGIGLYARIIGLADTYEAMTHTRPYHARKLPLFVVKEIVEKMRGKFDTKVIKALLEEVTMFPVGSFVRLNNREVGRVIAAIKGAHFRHVVQILFGPDGMRLIKPKTINLMEAHLLYITEPVDERDLGQ